MNRRRGSSLASSPLLVGAVTTLVVIVAVFISYNANAGLPFVPSYTVTARVPDASGLVRANEVRVGGKRVGIVKSIRAVPGPGGRHVAELELKLVLAVRPLRSGSEVTVRPLSPLGLKYLELRPGTSGRPVAERGTLPLARATPTVELDEVLNTFNVQTRRALQVAVNGLGPALAGRGPDLNELIDRAPPLLSHLERVSANVSDPRTNLRGLVRGTGAAVSELAAAGPQLGSLVAGADATAGALADRREQLGQVIGEAPPTETAGTSALRAARPVLAGTEAFLRDARPGLRVLAPATEDLDRALRTGTPVLRRATGLAGRLRTTLGSVDRLVRDPATPLALRKLRAVLISALPTVEFVAPFQTRCNYLGMWTRNVNSTISEGDNAGTWFRTLLVQRMPEQLASAAPVPGLHVDPYGHTGAASQGGECEVGNEGYGAGTQIGNVPGFQGGATEDTRPPAGTPRGP